MYLERELTEILGESGIIKNEPMSEHTSMKVGGGADLFLSPMNEDELICTVRLLHTGGVPYFILGRGTNIIVRDGGFRGAVVMIGSAFAGIDIAGETITAGAGATLSSVASGAAAAGLTGMEALSGIPGSIGGALYMNAGAYGAEMSQIVSEAAVYDVFNDNVITVNPAKMRLGYRMSTFQETNGVILSVTLSLTKGEPDEIRAKMKDFTKRRNDKQPVSLPSAGSFFKRPEGAYAGALIEQAGLKGYGVGGAQISEKHAGFIVNNGGASAADVIALAGVVRDKVKSESGYLLQPEPRIIGEDIEEKIEEKIEEIIGENIGKDI
jgi:UDP-N-acetylmuramate dehydrogenase